MSSMQIRNYIIAHNKWLLSVSRRKDLWDVLASIPVQSMPCKLSLDGTKQFVRFDAGMKRAYRKQWRRQIKHLSKSPRHQKR